MILPPQFLGESRDVYTKKTNFEFGYVFLIGSMYKQNINFNQSIKQCCINDKKYAFLLKIIPLWINLIPHDRGL